jgi:DNA-binding transcriptional MerR regulator
VTGLTIDELARRTGMTARNVRAHQSRGLLPPPQVRGRTGFYGEEHVARIALIRELQAEGFSLELIGKVLEGSTAAARFARALREPFADEAPAEVTLGELEARWGSADPELLERAEALGLMRPLGDGRWEERSPRLARASAELARLGIPAAQALELAAVLREHADSVARAYVRLFTDSVWGPFEAAGRPPERWSEVSDALERLRPLAAESLLAVFAISMDDAAGRAFREP